MSVNHRWHTLVEDPKRTPEPFREIIGDDFTMEYGHGAVRSYDELSDWVYGSASSINASRHDLESFTWTPIGHADYQAVFVLDWCGLSRDDKIMVAKTRHTWRIKDDLTRVFPSIEHMDVHFLEPFKIIED